MKTIINNTEYTEVMIRYENGEEDTGVLEHDLGDVNRDGDTIYSNGAVLPTCEEEVEYLHNEPGTTYYHIEDGIYVID